MSSTWLGKWNTFRPNKCIYSGLHFIYFLFHTYIFLPHCALQHIIFVSLSCNPVQSPLWGQIRGLFFSMDAHSLMSSPRSLFVSPSFLFLWKPLHESMSERWWLHLSYLFLICEYNDSWIVWKAEVKTTLCAESKMPWWFVTSDISGANK